MKVAGSNPAIRTMENKMTGEQKAWVIGFVSLFILLGVMIFFIAQSNNHIADVNKEIQEKCISQGRTWVKSVEMCVGMSPQ